MSISREEFYGQQGSDDPIVLLRPLPPPILPSPVPEIEGEIIKYLQFNPNHAFSFDEIYSIVKEMALRTPVPFIFNIAMEHLIHMGRIDGKYLSILNEWHYIIRN